MKFKACQLSVCAAMLCLISPAEAQNYEPSLLNVSSVAINQEVSHNLGMDTSTGPGNGKLASAWAVNQILAKAVGYSIGKDSNSVLSVEESLKAGQGILISDHSVAIPGDIIVASQDNYIGICLDNGCNKVISNLASKAQFGWLTNSNFDDLLKEPSKIYRVVDLQLLQF